MAVGKPVFGSDYQLIDKQTCLAKIKETAIIEDRKDKDTGEAKKSGREFQVKFELTSGHQAGLIHTDFFYDNSRDDFSLFKLAGLLMKAGIMPISKEVDTDVFKQEQFRKKFKSGISGKQVGIKFKHGKNNEGNLRAEVDKYLTVEEFRAESAVGTETTPTTSPAAAKETSQAAGWL